MSAEKETVVSAKVLRLRYKDKFGNPIAESTWNRWLKPLRHIIPLHTKVYNVKHLKAIYDHLGEPEQETEKPR